MTGKAIRWAGGDATTEAVERVALGTPLLLEETAWHRIQESHQRLTRYQSENRLIYGVTTGYGPLANTLVGNDHSEALQRNLVAHLSAGVGEALSSEQTRATMAEKQSLRHRSLNGLAWSLSSQGAKMLLLWLMGPPP